MIFTSLSWGLSICVYAVRCTCYPHFHLFITALLNVEPNHVKSFPNIFVIQEWTAYLTLAYEPLYLDSIGQRKWYVLLNAVLSWQNPCVNKMVIVTWFNVYRTTKIYRTQMFIFLTNLDLYALHWLRKGGSKGINLLWKLYWLFVKNCFFFWIWYVYLYDSYVFCLC